MKRMHGALAALTIALLLMVSCSARVRVNSGPADEAPKAKQRFQSQTVGQLGFSGTIYLVSDNGTGTEYLVVSKESGVAIVPIGEP